MVATVPQTASDMTDSHALLRVLVVEDEDLIRWTLAKALRKRGHTVVEAGDGESGLSALEHEAEPFDVVVLDYRLPDRQDLSLLEDVRRLSPGSAVFMMTAFADRDMRARAAAGGARAVVDKPFRVMEFVSLLENAERQ
jgi:DNA-binding NtrC family response regulator